MSKKFLNVSLFICISILLCYTCGIGINNIFRYNRFRLELKYLNETLIYEQEKSNKLKKKLLKIKSKNYIELLAKQRLGYVKPRETVFKLYYNQGTNLGKE